MDFVVTRAPFRISFAGGGTDLPPFYQRDYGAVLSSTIDKYVYVMVNKCRPLLRRGIDDPGRFRIRLSYSSTEHVESPDQLKHPIAREALKLLDLDIPMDIATMADVPAGTGLGSSASFAVALLHALHLIKGDEVSREQLAAEAAHIEIDKLGRPVGKQDHYAAAFGGLNLIRFDASEKVKVHRVGSLDLARSKLFPSLLLLYTGISRDASDVLSEQQKNINEFYPELLAMRDHAYKLERLLVDGFQPQHLGEVIHQGWMHKRRLAATITNSRIDRWYDRAREAGALGGKICGAGGGGFLLLVVEPERRAEVRQALQELPDLPITYEPQGSQVLLPRSDLDSEHQGGTA